jgi:hypothetical protein
MTETKTWIYDSANNQWDMADFDGHVWQDENLRFKAFWNGALVGAFVSEEVAKSAIENRAEAEGLR